VAEKEDILQEIRRQAAINDGVPLGKERFEVATGIKASAWVGRYWVRWGDALVEAGFAPNQWQGQKLSDEELIKELAILALELGHYPVVAEVKFHHSKYPSFPDQKTFRNRFGTQQEQLRRLMNFVKGNPEYQDVYGMCAPLVKSVPDEVSSPRRNASVPGRVYMIYSQSLKLYKIGESDDLKRRYQEIQSAVPGKLDEIHVLETDDPAGIERYWHRRFKHHKKINEWFELTASDVEAFKSRGKSM
jgi:hypothetical protein